MSIYVYNNIHVMQDSKIQNCFYITERGANFSRYRHSMTFCQIHNGKVFYNYSFFPLATVEWNAITANFAVAPSRLENFKAEVEQLQHLEP